MNSANPIDFNVDYISANTKSSFLLYFCLYVIRILLHYDSKFCNITIVSHIIVTQNEMRIIVRKKEQTPKIIVREYMQQVTM